MPLFMGIEQAEAAAGQEEEPVAGLLLTSNKIEISSCSSCWGVATQ